MEEQKIKVADRRGEFDIEYGCVRTYHIDGNYAMLAVMFQGIKGAFALLSESDTIQRDSVYVLCGHPGTGVRDAFEFITRAVTRGVYALDCSLPYARFNPHKEMAYYFELSNATLRVKAQMKEGILPSRFFELFGVSKNKTVTKAEAEEFEILKEAIEKKVLAMQPNEIFTYEVE